MIFHDSFSKTYSFSSSVFCALIFTATTPPFTMQCTAFYRDPYETAAWQLYLRECAMRAAREEVAFLEATGGVTEEDLRRIRERAMAGGIDMNNNQNHIIIPTNPPQSTTTVSLKSVLTEVVQSQAINQLCRRVRPLLEQNGIVTFKKHQAIHVLQADAQRVRDLGMGLV